VAAFGSCRWQRFGISYQFSCLLVGGVGENGFDERKLRRSDRLGSNGGIGWATSRRQIQPRTNHFGEHQRYGEE
jgi:hypothetical protein